MDKQMKILVEKALIVNLMQLNWLTCKYIFSDVNPGFLFLIISGKIIFDDLIWKLITKMYTRYLFSVSLHLRYFIFNYW